MLDCNANWLIVIAFGWQELHIWAKYLLLIDARNVLFFSSSMSPEQINSIDDSEGGVSGGEVSEEAQQRVRDSQAKAHQVRQQIQQNQQQNKQHATMLSTLLQYVNDEGMLGHIFHQLVDYQVSTPAIFAQFLPVLRHRIDIAMYQSLYGELRQKLPKQDTVVSSVDWLKEVRQIFSVLKNIPMQSYLSFVLDYLHRMRVVDLTSLEPEKRSVLEATLHKELF